MRIIQNLIDNRKDINRTIDKDPTTDLIHTETWSERQEVTDWIQQHVIQMVERFEDDQMIRSWDPLFVALFENKDDIIWSLTNTTKGVSVDSEGMTPCGTSLAWAHAQVVSAFVNRGRAEVREPHEVLGEWQC